MSEPQKISAMVPISRELAVAYGLVEPTEAENAAMRENHIKWAAWRQRQQERHKVALTRMRLIGGPLVRRLLSLHAADERGECQGCDFTGAEAERPDWPCRTVHTIAGYFQLELEEPSP